MSETELLCEVKESIGYIKINRLKGFNNFNKSALAELENILVEWKTNENCRAVIISGAGEKAFCSGADVNVFIEEREKAMGGLEWSREGQRVFAKFDDLGKPSIAAVNGVAFGGGFELALACTFRIASQKARFRFPEITLGFIPGWGGTQRAARLLGKTKALELLLTGDMIDADQACALGIVNRVVTPEALIETCEEMARKIIKNAPTAIRFAIEVVSEGLNLPLGSGMKLESSMASMACLSEDAKEGINAFFEKRKPVFKGR